MEFIQIGTFHCQAKYPYDVPRQGILASENTGWIELAAGRDFETALEELAGFSRIWVVFVFDRNGDQWHPKVQPPRHTDHKIGVFATRSPYRPNPIGLSCVELLEVRGRTLFVKGHDLLDGTPILDIKPYLPYADAFPDARAGWTESLEKPQFQVGYSSSAKTQLEWLAERGLQCLADFIQEQLSEDPLNPKRHRLMKNPTRLAYRTWRALFQVDENTVTVTEIQSGYSAAELAVGTEDRYQDKSLHREFLTHFPQEDSH